MEGLVFKSGESWKNLGTCSEVKAKMGLEAVKLLPTKDGKSKFVLFLAKDGTYATARYDNKANQDLTTAVVWATKDGILVGKPTYALEEKVALQVI